MRRTLSVSLAAILAATPALAASNLMVDVAHGGLGNGVGDASLLTVAPPLAQNPATLKGLFGPPVIHTATYGSFCDGNHHYLSSIAYYGGQTTTGWTAAQWQSVFPTLPGGANVSATDIDGLAISAAFAAGVASGNPFRLVVDGSNCFATYSINHTGLTRYGVVLDYSGVQVYSVAVNAPAIDLANSQFLTTVQPNVIGDCTNEPYVGIRYARTVPGQPAGDQLVIRPQTSGCFTHGGMEMVSTEVDSVIQPLITNQDQTGGFGLVLDGINHFNFSTTEPYQTVTSPVDTYESFTQNNFIGGHIACSTCASPVWIAGLHEANFPNVYINNANPGVGPNYGVTFFETVPSLEVNVDMTNVKVEGANLYSTFRFTAGSPTALVIRGFRYSTQSEWGGTAAIGIDTTNVTSLSLRDTDIRIPLFRNGSSIPLFDAPGTLIASSGNLSVPARGNMPFLPFLWTGKICVLQNCQQPGPTLPLNTNGDFLYDAPWEHAVAPTSVANLGAISDAWLTSEVGAATNRVTWQDKNGAGCNGDWYGETATVSSTLSVGATDAIAMRTSLSGDVMSALDWGSSAAQPITVDMYAKASSAGTYAVDVSNISANRHLTHNLVLSAANTCQEFVFQIPGYPSLNFGVLPTAQSLRFQVVLDAGSSLQQAPDVWTTTSAASVIGTPQATHMLATAGATLSVSSVHLYPGYYLQTYAGPTWGAETANVLKIFQKSPPAGTGPSANNTYQNVGHTGAFSFVAGATGTVTAWVPFVAPMVATPTVGLYSTAANTGNCYDVTASADIGAASASNISNRGFLLTCPSATAGHQIDVNYTTVVTQ